MPIASTRIACCGRHPTMCFAHCSLFASPL
jgi:hypothetical protein